MTTPADENGALIEERMVLAKYEGDPSEAEIAAGEVTPIETITVVNGEIVEHWVKEE